MKTRRIVGDILVFLSVAFTIYLSIIMIRRINIVVLKDDYIKVFRYELIACAFFILFALDVRFGFFTKINIGVVKVVGWVLRIIVTLMVAALLFFIGKITVGSLINTAAPANNAIVLGLALENGQPTDDLIFRLQAAEGYLEENPEATLILTGGNPDESGKTEAAVMHDLLSKDGVPDERMMLEDRATDTKENFKNTLSYVDPAEPVVLISSNYHMDRATGVAKKAGFQNILRLPAPSSFLPFGANVMWEVIMELNNLL